MNQSEFSFNLREVSSRVADWLTTEIKWWACYMPFSLSWKQADLKVIKTDSELYHWGPASTNIEHSQINQSSGSLDSVCTNEDFLIITSHQQERMVKITKHWWLSKGTNYYYYIYIYIRAVR